MLHGKKALIFDMDGSLVDSMWVWKDIDVEYLSKFGYTIPNDLQKNIEGKSFTETAKRLLIGREHAILKRQRNLQSFFRNTKRYIYILLLEEQR